MIHKTASFANMVPTDKPQGTTNDTLALFSLQFRFFRTTMVEEYGAGPQNMQNQAQPQASQGPTIYNWTGQSKGLMPLANPRSKCAKLVPDCVCHNPKCGTHFLCLKNPRSTWIHRSGQFTKRPTQKTCQVDLNSAHLNFYRFGQQTWKLVPNQFPSEIPHCKSNCTIKDHSDSSLACPGFHYFLSSLKNRIFASPHFFSIFISDFLKHEGSKQ